jgi:hypothetical protein
MQDDYRRRWPDIQPLFHWRFEFAKCKQVVGSGDVMIQKQRFSIVDRHASISVLVIP